jgi:hypothetical protein
MRRSFLAICLLTGLGSVTVTQSGYSQGFGTIGTPRPSVSPYLNLLRGGNPGFLNYYGLVRPEQQMRSAANNFQMQLGNLNQSINNLQQYSGGPGANLATGHAFGFQTQAQYFMTTGAGGGMGGGGMGARGPALGTGAGARGGQPGARR